MISQLMQKSIKLKLNGPKPRLAWISDIYPDGVGALATANTADIKIFQIRKRKSISRWEKPRHQLLQSKIVVQMSYAANMFQKKYVISIPHHHRKITRSEHHSLTKQNVIITLDTNNNTHIVGHKTTTTYSFKGTLHPRV